MSRPSNTFVLSITHLKDRPNEKHALDLLKKIVSLVKPIMRKHGWVLPELAEFFPDQTNLLGMNMNMGQKIMLRLRPHHSPTWFLEEEEILQTMLHELTHNVHGPHDDKFYKFLSGLQDEYEELRRKGYSGEGFFTPGQRLGGSTAYVNGRALSHNPPPAAGRLKALEAAEKRKQVSRVLGGVAGGSRTLGGRGGNRSGTGRVLTPRELAAQAAERRMRDTTECGSQQPIASIQRESDKASREGVKNDVIDLTMDDDMWEPDWISDDENPALHADTKGGWSDDEVEIVKDLHLIPPRDPVAGPSFRTGQGTSSRNPIANARDPNRRAVSDPYPRAGPSTQANSGAARPPASSSSKRPQEHLKWQCEICTLINEPIALQCDACGMRRPPDQKAGWTCLACGETGMPHEFWTCRACGVVKSSS
ncbi:WLM-domain-containing protein [Coprinellus micaceus]|uniref:WLM-domain-containing protein n=1 Tax=Coprinellus micaceus TaxID=71717 RepID=A0A4Y7TYY5_COPMI|nr:WLM-domain-containing protein [Coprinellus micaceus]